MRFGFFSQMALAQFSKSIFQKIHKIGYNDPRWILCQMTVKKRSLIHTCMYFCLKMTPAQFQDFGCNFANHVLSPDNVTKQL